jgi:hypothetical protein
MVCVIRARWTVSHILAETVEEKKTKKMYSYSTHHKKNTFSVTSVKMGPWLNLKVAHRGLEPQSIGWIVLEVQECLDTRHTVKTGNRNSITTTG